jgi:hypothetical protein
VYTRPRQSVELRNTSLFVAIKSVNLRNLAPLSLLRMVTSEIEIGRNFRFKLYLCAKRVSTPPQAHMAAPQALTAYFQAPT